jgi:hypothetical protein
MKTLYWRDLIGNRTHHLPAYSVVPQPTTLPRAPKPMSTHWIEVSDGSSSNNLKYREEDRPRYALNGKHSRAVICSCTVTLGFGPRRDPWPYFLFLPWPLNVVWNEAYTSTRRGSVITEWEAGLAKCDLRASCRGRGGVLQPYTKAAIISEFILPVIQSWTASVFLS